MIDPVSWRHGSEPTLLSGDHMTAIPGRRCACMMASFELRASVGQRSKEHCDFDLFQRALSLGVDFIYLVCVFVPSFVLCFCVYI